MQGVDDNLRIEGRPAYNNEFAKVVSASRINLCFLRHANRDLQTCRSIELPGCAGFMVHERNPEIEALLKDGEAAVYFSSDDELAEVCAYWMDRDADRLRIGQTARRRVEELELSHRANIVRALNELSRNDEVTPR
jgi:spore maturation protein CgeB